MRSSNNLGTSTQSAIRSILQFTTAVEPQELRAVMLSMVCFFFIFGSYSIVKPVRDAMGTVYGMKHIQELFTGTFVASLLLTPLYSGLASRIRLSTFLPWVYGLIATSLLLFYGLMAVGHDEDRWIAGSFYIWVSTFNLLIISVFWSFMTDLFSPAQAKRLFAFIAAGATLGGIAGPAVATFSATSIGNSGLILLSAVGFAITAFLISLTATEKQRLLAINAETQRTRLDHDLPGSPFGGFKLLLRSRYLLLLAAFLLLMTWISTIVYIQLGDLITQSFPNKAARAQAYAAIELTVNSFALLIQLFGTGRIIERFGVTTGLLLNPLVMVIAFLAVVFSPVLLVLGGIQVVRRVAEYAIAKPTREMLFTAVDQESRYKAKNLIDTVVYRFGDLSSAWVSTLVLPFGVVGLSVFGAVIAALWFPVGYALGKRYEHVRAAAIAAAEPAAVSLDKCAA